MGKKLLLVGEYKEKLAPPGFSELLGLAEQVGGEHVAFLVGTEQQLPSYDGRLYLADVKKHGEYNPEAHKQLLLEVIDQEQPDMVVLHHSSYGWDLGPRIACACKTAQISEAIAYSHGRYIVPFCNGKLRREVKSTNNITVLTIQPGAFQASHLPTARPQVVHIDGQFEEKITFQGFTPADTGTVDLSKADIIVAGGRGMQKQANMELIQQLAQALGGEHGATRPVVDAQWTEYQRQIGTTGQRVAPKLYIACGISGAIQHTAAIKQAEFIVAINTDPDAPIRDIADILVESDLTQLIPELIQLLQNQ